MGYAGTQSSRKSLFGHQLQARDIPGKMMHCTAGGEDDGASRGEGQSDQALAGDFQARLRVRRDLHDPTRAVERCGDVEIAVRVKRQALRPSQAFIKSSDGAVGIDTVDAVVRSGDEEVAFGAERQVIGRDTEFERGENEDLLVARDLEDGSIAVADVEAL